MDQQPIRRKILYVGPLGPGTSLFRKMALERLGQEVVPFDTARFTPQSRFLSALQYRYPVWPLNARANRELLQAVAAHKPDVVWLDKPLLFTPETIKTIKQAGAMVVCLLLDNPFGPRNDGCWLQFYRIYRLMDLHCLVRNVDVGRYSSWGLPFVKIQLSYEPTRDFPPPCPWTDADRTRDISFTGTPYDDRPEFLRKLAEDYGLPVMIAGGGWADLSNAERYARLVTQNEVVGAAYREMIWKSKINIAFVTRSNEEDVAHKAFEITACAAFLMAERSQGHLESFAEDKEAVFFSSIEECADKCRFYLAHPEARQAIAQRGYERAMRSGYDNDTQIKKILLRLDGANKTTL